MEEFLEYCEEVRKFALSFKEPLIVHHYDADGLASGAIVINAMLKAGKAYRSRAIKKLDDAAIETLVNEKEIIFVDLGGGNVRVNELQDIVIIDHHQTSGIKKMQANPILHGIDGGDELSAAGTAYCVFRNNVELGVVGAVGDMQHPLKGFNRWLLEEGEKTGEIKIENDLRFYGRYCRPLVQFLTYSDDPYIPMISYREERALKLLDDLGIALKEGEYLRVYADLSVEEKRKLISAIATLLPTMSKTKELIGESYVFPKRPKNETFEANEFSTLLNACGRHGKAAIGIGVCLNKEEAYEEARGMLLFHRRALKEGIDCGARRIQDFGNFRFLDARNIIEENIIGTICGMLLNPKIEKPIIGIANGEANTIKVSARASNKLIAEGLNLGQIMKESAAKVNGIGGGHRIAAGASIPANLLNEFLLLLDEKCDKGRSNKQQKTNL
jgi:RecJ-like exonuclease